MDVQILELRVLKTSRDISGINVILDSISNSLNVNFKALEEYDGCSTNNLLG
jgi:hypothetical protein